MGAAAGLIGSFMGKVRFDVNQMAKQATESRRVWK